MNTSIVAGFVIVFLVGCAPTQGEPVDADIGDLKGLEGDFSPSQEVTYTKPEGYAAIRFKVDDTASKTYKDGQMKWTGSFSWNRLDNTIVYASSWLPTDGPFPPLYDDGPWTEGGHEPEGAVAGDHIFEKEVFFKAEKETTFEYGVLNEYDRWIWIGPNGQFTVPAGYDGIIEAKPLIIPAFGETDMRVMIDMKHLHPDFSPIKPFDPETETGYYVYFKSSANSWTPVQLLDNGEKGDEVAGDLVFTYHHKENLGPHDGLLYHGQHVQFVFVFATPDQSPDEGIEYKSGSNCVTEGVTAQTDFGTPGSFHDEPILMERDSRGYVFNTTIIVGGGKPWCNEDRDCFGGAKCGEDGCDLGTVSQPTIISVEPEVGPTSGGTEVTIRGNGFVEGCKVFFGEKEAQIKAFVYDTTISAVTPPHPAGAVDVKVQNPDGGTAIKKAAFTYEGPPGLAITSVKPFYGSVLGGTEVMIEGSGFLQGARVLFGDIEVTPSVVEPDKIRLSSPSHPAGKVSITVVNPDSTFATLDNAFEFVLACGTLSINLDGDLSEWDEQLKIATNILPTNWGPGKNELKGLYVCYDNEYLYLGIGGMCEAQNAVVGYIDLDFGSGSGVRNMTEITDHTGALDDAVSSKVFVSESGFGAEVAFGTVGMASFTDGKDFSKGGDSAGFRRIVKMEDLYWIEGVVVANRANMAIEAQIPLEILRGQRDLQNPTQLAIFARLLSSDGQYTSNQCLPECTDAEAFKQTSTAKFILYR